MNKSNFTVIFAVLLLTLNFHYLIAAPDPWVSNYQNALKEMKNSNWQQAIRLLEQSLEVKGFDTKKIRAYGTIFMEYYPNRQMGICYYNLGEYAKAKEYLQYSLQQEPSDEARDLLNLIENSPASAFPSEKKSDRGDQNDQFVSDESQENLSNGAEIVGDRLSIAVLPFESKGLGNEIGSIDLLDKLITGFVRINRFKVVERALLEKILEEQQLGMSGVIDASTAAQVGKGIGVDAVVVGSVTRVANAVSIDARLIETETAAIISAKDAFSNSISLQNISDMILDLAEKFKKELPILHGYVIKVNDKTLTLDIGRNHGVRRGMKFHVYREGAPIIHPVTSKVIAKNIDELCEIQINQIFEAYSIGRIVKEKAGYPQIRDRIVSK